MIAFDLECSNGHLFEGWFKNFNSFEEQNGKNLVNCPYCNDTKIKKILSPVAVKSVPSHADGESGPSIDYQRLAREVIHYINTNFVEVGSDFAKEALKMHFGVSEKKNIKGSATPEEEKVLKDEGIDFFKIPVPKTDDEKKN